MGMGSYGHGFMLMAHGILWAWHKKCQNCGPQVVGRCFGLTQETQEGNPPHPEVEATPPGAEGSGFITKGRFHPNGGPEPYPSATLFQ